jgi:hypothetical protein
MPSKRKGRGRKGRKGASGSDSSAKLFAANHVMGSALDTIRVPTDYSRRRASWFLTQTPPKSIRDQIHWFEVTETLVSSGAVSSSPTTTTEFNQSFTLGVWANYTSITGLFDQYCIHSVLVNISTEAVFTAVAGAGRCTTAIDYDNVANLSSESDIQAFASAETVTVVPHMNIQRYVEPCVTTALYQTSSTGYGSQRLWIDAASPNVPHYGLRILFVNNNVSGFTIDVVCSFRYGARNSA